MSDDDEFLQSLRATFKVEADEHLQAISGGLLELEKTTDDAGQHRLIEIVFRAAHSLKGASRAVGFDDIESICQSMEDVFGSWKNRESAPERAILDTLHQALDAITAILVNPVAPAVPPPVFAPIMPIPLEPEYEPAPRLVEAAVSLVLPPPPPVGEPVEPVIPTPEAPAPAKTTAGGQTIRIPVDKLDGLLVEVEEMLAAKLSASQRSTDLRELLSAFEGWAKEWVNLQPEIDECRQRLEPSHRDTPVPAGFHRLMEFADWTRDYFRLLESKVNTLSHTADQDRQTMGRLVDNLLTDSKRMLMLPLSTLGSLFPKIVRDICRDQGKEAELVVRGGEIELDKRILEEMKDPLIHILRNCVDHGIEKPEERQRRGKPATATITLAVSRLEGNKVELLVFDDGGGIDPEKVRQAAIKHHVVSAEEASQLSEAESQALIFRSEVSTSPIITQLSGRGLGLAIVREKTAKLGGKVSVESQLGRGTTFRIILPVTLATFRGILVQAAKRIFIVPTSNVERVLRFQPDEIQTVEGRETLALNGRPIALVRLAEVLGLPAAERPIVEAGGTPAVILGAGDHRLAFAVDAIVREEEVLVKPLKKPLLRLRNISGATVLGSGQVAPILHVEDLLKSARQAGRAAAAKGDAGKAEAKSVLIAEDSITSRMLLKGILESAGFRVKTAVDGLEAFTTLRAEHFDLVVSDVEMPRLNGFDLTARIRADRRLAETPVILVTALDSREDRERGIDVGANAYLVKTSFDQSNLLEAVRRLI